jgi:hypothetical protein
MRYRWELWSFETARFRAAFPCEGERERLRLYELCYRAREGVPASRLHLFEGVIDRLSQGLSYVGLSEPEAHVLDGLTHQLLGPDGLWEDLAMRRELLDNELSLVFAGELIRRAGSKLPLASFSNGRRPGLAPDPGLSWDPYLVVQGEELDQLVEQLETVSLASQTGEDDAVVAYVDEHLLPLLLDLSEQERGLYARLLH